VCELLGGTLLAGWKNFGKSLEVYREDVQNICAEQGGTKVEERRVRVLVALWLELRR